MKRLDETMSLNSNRIKENGDVEVYRLMLPALKPPQKVSVWKVIFGLLAVELAVKLTADQGENLSHALALGFFIISFFFVYRSFYGMRIVKEKAA